MLEKEYEGAVRQVGDWEDFEDRKGATDVETVDLDEIFMKTRMLMLVVRRKSQTCNL
jgi:hypothetical protein